MLTLPPERVEVSIEEDTTTLQDLRLIACQKFGISSLAFRHGFPPVNFNPHNDGTDGNKSLSSIGIRNQDCIVVIDTTSIIASTPVHVVAASSRGSRSIIDGDDDNDANNHCNYRKRPAGMDYASWKLTQSILAKDNDNRRNSDSDHKELDHQTALKLQQEHDKQERKGIEKRKRIEKCDEELARKLQQADDNEQNSSHSSLSSSLLMMSKKSASELRKELKSYGVDSNLMIEKHELVDALETAKAAGGMDEKENDLALARRLQEKEQRKYKKNQRYMKQPTKEQVLASLDRNQLAAVNHVKTQAKTMHEMALPNLTNRIKNLGGHTNDEDLIECLNYIRDDVPIIIHMKEETLSLLVKDTHYRNQFETNASGGCMNHASRQLWERGMFGSKYDGVDGRQRVKYGCINVSGDIAGVKSARCFGPLFLILHPHVRHRTTFFNMDTGQAFCPSFSTSTYSTNTLATNEYYAHVLNGYNDSDLEAILEVCKSARVGGAPSNCTQYKEVQIHGPVCLADDIQALSIPGREKNASQKLIKNVDMFRTKTNCNILWQEDLLNPEE